MNEQKPRGFFKNGEPYAEPAGEKRDVFRPRVRCAVCHHPERVRIEALRTAGVSLDKLSELFGIHRDAIWRHCERHVSDEGVLPPRPGEGCGPCKRGGR